MALTNGTKLGPYEIQSLLGAGGMGEVYRAKDTRLDRIVAIKILSTHLSDNPEIKQRFEREARTISSLNHPHICHLYDIGSQDGTDFLVMEFLEGETLAERLRKGPLPTNELLKIGMDIAEALEVAHRAGITHRDLKPGNIMLTKAGAKLMDFGLAKPSAMGSAASGPAPLLSAARTLSGPSPSPLTTAGSIVGTIQYMSPEQIEGLEADPRSDIFAFGAVLYEMATGRRAFEGKSQITVASAILEKDPDPISKQNALAPAALDYLVGTCLAKSREDRFQSAQDVRLQLKWIAQGGSMVASSPVVSAAMKKPSRMGWIVAAVLLLVAICAAAAYFNLAMRPESVLRTSITPPPGTTFVTVPNDSGPPVLSPDGMRIAFSARDAKGKTLLYVRPLRSFDAQALAGTENAIYPFWSPDNQAIAFFAEGKLKKIDVAGGPTQTLASAIAGRGGAWSKAGVIVYTPSASSGLFRVSAAGGTSEPASKLDPGKANSHRWPWFLPDGQHYLYWARSSGEESMLMLGTLGSLEGRFLMKTELPAVYVSGYLLTVRGTTLVALPFDAKRAEVTGDPVPVAEHVAVNNGTNRPIFSASDNGTLVFQARESVAGWNLNWYTRDGKITPAIPEPGEFYFPALSPDGTRLAVAIGSSTSDIWSFDLQRGTKTRLTFGGSGSTQSNPVWTPDGKTLYYSKATGGIAHIFSRPADGSGTERAVLPESKDAEVPSSISPDGKYLGFRRRRLSESRSMVDIWAIPLAGGDPFPLIRNDFDSSLLAISPDGKWLAYANGESGRNELYITAFPGGGAKWQVSTNGGNSPKWRKDGKELFFVDATDEICTVDVAVRNNAVQLGLTHVLFHAPGIERSSPYDVTADGKKFLVNSGSINAGNEPLSLVQNWLGEIKK